VRDPVALARIHDEILPAYLADTMKARLQQPDGTYVRASKALKDVSPFSAQEFLMQVAEGKTDLSAIPKPSIAKPRPSRPRRTRSSARRRTSKAVAAD
jgi:polyphosphate kinase